MRQGMQLVVYPVKDVARAKPNGPAKGMTGPIGYVEVGDIHGRLRSLLEARAHERQRVTDVGGGKLIAWLEDADGNLIGLRQTPA